MTRVSSESRQHGAEVTTAALVALFAELDSFRRASAAEVDGGPVARRSCFHRPSSLGVTRSRDRPPPTVHEKNARAPGR